jgi:hypothetical protein
LHIGGVTFSSYAAVNALLLNLVIAVILTLLLNLRGPVRTIDETCGSDYDDSERGVELSSERATKEYQAPQVSR